MPAPRHLRHPPATLSPSPYHPRSLPNFSAYSTRSPRSIGSPYSTATYAPPLRPTSSPPNSTSIYAPRTRLLPHIVIPSSVALSYPSAQPPTPLPHAPTPSSAPRSYLSILLPTLFRGKVCTPPPKASSNPPVEIFCPKRRRTLILNTLPRRHHVDNSVNSHVHSE